MNRYPAWKYAIIAIALLIGLIYTPVSYTHLTLPTILRV